MPQDPPNNLPIEGKNLLDNVKTEESPPGADTEKMESPPSSVSQPVPPKPEAKAPTDAETQDIFADIKESKTATPPSATDMDKKTDAGTPMPATDEEGTQVETPQKGFKKVLATISVIIVVVAVLAGGGYWAYMQFFQPQELSPNLNMNVSLPPAATVVPVQPVAPPVPLDSDNDGLTDEEEQTLGTNPLNPDSDGDRLLDREEVMTYKTDPLIKDTDGDGYDDGAEVQAGYDPKGPGKLIVIPSEGTQ